LDRRRSSRGVGRRRRRLGRRRRLTGPTSEKRAGAAAPPRRVNGVDADDDGALHRTIAGVGSSALRRLGWARRGLRLAFPIHEAMQTTGKRCRWLRLGSMWLGSALLAVTLSGCAARLKAVAAEAPKAAV